MKAIIVIALSFCLAGCFTKAVIHPPKPLPVMSYESNMFMDSGNICMSPESFLEHRLFLEDLKRYITDQNDIILFYQR